METARAASLGSLPAGLQALDRAHTRRLFLRVRGTPDRGPGGRAEPGTRVAVAGVEGARTIIATDTSPSFWIWYLVWSPGWGWGRPYYGHRWEKQQGREARVPLYKKVFAFVFGPDRPRPTRAQRDRSVVRLIRARRGVLTALDLVRHTGFDRTDADDELARLMVAYEGDVRVSGEGELVYVFPELMVSAHGGVRERLPDPAWRRL